LGIQPQADLIA